MLLSLAKHPNAKLAVAHKFADLLVSTDGQAAIEAYRVGNQQLFQSILNERAPKAPVIRRLEDGTNEFTKLRRGFLPAQPKRPSNMNFHSEGRWFSVGRYLVPGLVLLRVHRNEIAEDKVEVYEGR